MNDDTLSGAGDRIGDGGAKFNHRAPFERARRCHEHDRQRTILLLGRGEHIAGSGAMVGPPKKHQRHRSAPIQHRYTAVAPVAAPAGNGDRQATTARMFGDRIAQIAVDRDAQLDRAPVPAQRTKRGSCSGNSERAVDPHAVRRSNHQRVGPCSLAAPLQLFHRGAGSQRAVGVVRKRSKQRQAVRRDTAPNDSGHAAEHTIDALPVFENAVDGNIYNDWAGLLAGREALAGGWKLYGPKPLPAWLCIRRSRMIKGAISLGKCRRLARRSRRHRPARPTIEASCTAWPAATTPAYRSG